MSYEKLYGAVPLRKKEGKAIIWGEFLIPERLWVQAIKGKKNIRIAFVLKKALGSSEDPFRGDQSSSVTSPASNKYIFI